MVRQIKRVVTPEQVQAFVEGNDSMDLGGAGCLSTYEFIVRALGRFGYRGFHEGVKGLVRCGRS